MNITLKGIQYSERMSDETYCFSATVYVDGKRAGTVMNHGTGGPNEYDFDTAALDAYCKGLPARKTEYGTFAVELDELVDDVFCDWLHVKELKRMTRGVTAFRLKGDAPDCYRTIRRPFAPEVRAHVVAKYGDQVEAFLNEDPRLAAK